MKEELEAAYHVEVFASVGDIADFSYVESLFSEISTRFGGIDILVNNAGISHIGLLQDMTIAEWNRIIGTNLTSVFSTCKLSIPHMLHNQGGKIVNISSVWGNVGASCEVAYSACKGGMNSFTKALAKELAPSSIQVNAIALRCDRHPDERLLFKGRTGRVSRRDSSRAFRFPGRSRQSGITNLHRQ